MKSIFTYYFGNTFYLFFCCSFKVNVLEHSHASPLKSIPKSLKFEKESKEKPEKESEKDRVSLFDEPLQTRRKQFIVSSQIPILKSKRFEKYRQKIVNANSDDDQIGNRWIGDFRQADVKLLRTKRRIKVVNRDKYNILTSNSARTPWGTVAKIFKKVVHQIKNKTDTGKSLVDYYYYYFFF